MNNGLERFANSIRSLKSTYPLEFYGGLLFIMGLPILALLIVLAPHSVTGENAWIKPGKFLLSTAIYVWTMGWIQMNLPEITRKPSAAKSQLSWWIVGGMAVENIIITLQASRGAQSHFNQTSIANTVLYAVMGVFAVAQIPVAIHILRKFMKSEIQTTLTLGIQLGLMAFILGGFEGAYLSAQRGHTVGAPDGGPGLRILNWSLQHGDLRIAHFVLLHGLQLLPILALVLSQNPKAKQLLKAAFAAMITVSIGLFAQALLGNSIISIF